MILQLGIKIKKGRKVQVQSSLLKGPASSNDLSPQPYGGGFSKLMDVDDNIAAGMLDGRLTALDQEGGEGSNHSWYIPGKKGPESPTLILDPKIKVKISCYGKVAAGMGRKERKDLLVLKGLQKTISCYKGDLSQSNKLSIKKKQPLPPSTKKSDDEVYNKEYLHYLHDLHRLVIEYYEHIPPTGLGLILHGDLTTMMETTEESDDELWRNQTEWEIIRWRLYESTGVHILELENGIMIHMLVEQRYPLTRELMQRMLEHKLEVQKETENALNVIRFVMKQKEDLEREEE
ncbi:hypothetical protein Tco_0721665 [Tanacetum coccineum]